METIQGQLMLCGNGSIIIVTEARSKAAPKGSGWSQAANGGEFIARAVGQDADVLRPFLTKEGYGDVIITIAPDGRIVHAAA